MKKFFNAVMFIMLLVGFSTTAKANVNLPITWAAGAEGDYVQMDNTSFVDVHTGGNDQGNMYPNFAFVKATDAGNVTAISMQISIENTNGATIKTENKSFDAADFNNGTKITGWSNNGYCSVAGTYTVKCVFSITVDGKDPITETHTGTFNITDEMLPKPYVRINATVTDRTETTAKINFTSNIENYTPEAGVGLFYEISLYNPEGTQIGNTIEQPQGSFELTGLSAGKQIGYTLRARFGTIVNGVKNYLKLGNDEDYTVYTIPEWQQGEVIDIIKIDGIVKNGDFTYLFNDDYTECTLVIPFKVNGNQTSVKNYRVYFGVEGGHNELFGLTDVPAVKDGNGEYVAQVKIPMKDPATVDGVYTNFPARPENTDYTSPNLWTKVRAVYADNTTSAEYSIGAFNVKIPAPKMEAVTFSDVKVTNTKLSQDMQSMIFSFQFTVNGDQADVNNYEVFVSRVGNEYMGPMTVVKKANGNGNITTYIGTVAVPINDVALPVNTDNIGCYFKVRANYANGTTGAATQAPVVTISTKADETGDPKFYITLTNYDPDTKVLSYSVRATGDLSTIDNVVPGWAVSNDPDTTPTVTNGEIDADSHAVRTLKPADFANGKVITGRLECDVDPSKSNKMWASLAIIYVNNTKPKEYIFDGPYDVRPNSERPGFVTVTNWERIDYKSGYITVEFALNTPETATSEGEKTLDDIQSVSIAFGHSCANHPAATERPLNRIDIPLSVLNVGDGKFTYTFEFEPRQELYPDGMHTGSQIQLWPKGRVNYKDGSNSPTNTNQKAVWVNFNPSVNMTLDASVNNKEEMQGKTDLVVDYNSTVAQSPDNFNAGGTQFYNYNNSIPDVNHYLVWMSTADDQYRGTTTVAKEQFVDGKLAGGAFNYTLPENFNKEAWLKIMPVYSDNNDAVADNTKATQTYLGWIDNRVPANPGTVTMTVDPVYVTVNPDDKTSGTLLCNYNIQMDETAVANITGFELYFSRQKQNGETVADDIDLEYLSAVKPDKNVFWPDADGNVSYTMNLANLPADVKSFPIWAKVRPVYADGFGTPAQGLIQVNTLDNTPMLVFVCNSTTATSDEGGKTEFTLHCTQNQDNLRNFDINWTYQVKENDVDTDTWTECADVKGLNFSMSEAANKDGFNIADHVFTGTVFLGPVNKSAVSNLHADLLARPVDGENINLNYGYNQAYTIDTSAPGLPTGIEGIDADDSDAVWFNLQGVRVVNPEPGQIYIVVRNGKAVRVMK